MVKVLPTTADDPFLGLGVNKGIIPDGGKLNSLIDRLQKQTKERSLPIVDFFQSFDGLGVKRITRPQFLRGLAISGLKVTPSEAQLLAGSFASSADPNLVDYVAFADKLGEVFCIKGLMKNPTYKVKLPFSEGFPIRLGMKKERLNETERGRVREVLESLAYTCATEGIDFNFLLAQYDHFHKGFISKNDFTRCMYQLLRRETPKDALLLARAYEDPEPGLVNYKVLADHLLTSIEAKQGMHMPRGLVHPRLSTSERAKLRRVLSRLASTPQASTAPRLLLEAFENYDYHAYGLVTRHNFLQALDSLWEHPPLDRDERNILSLAYAAVRDGKVDYNALDRDFQAIKAQEDGEKKRQTEVIAQTEAAAAAAAAAVAVQGGEGGMGITGAGELVAEGGLSATASAAPSSVTQEGTNDSSSHAHAIDVEKLVANRIIEGRITLIDLFLEHDKLHTNYVSRNAFHRILSQCLRSPLVSESIDALQAKHGGKPSGNNVDESQIDYKSFLSSIDDMVKRTYPASSLVPRDHLSGDEQVKLEEILGRIRSQVASTRTQIRPVLEDFDKTKECYVSKAQFMRVLYMYNLLPTAQEEQERLLHAYQPTNPLDSRTYMINYGRFLADVDESSLKLPKAEDLSPHNHLKCISQPPAGLGQAVDPQKVLSTLFLGTQDRSVEVLLKEIRAHVLKHRMSLDEYLKDQDRLRQGFLTRTQLGRALSRCGIRMTDTECEALSNLFPVADKVDTQGRLMVQYPALLDEIEKVFNVKGLERTPQLPAHQLVEQANDEVYDVTPLLKSSSTASSSSNLATQKLSSTTFTEVEQKKLEEALSTLAHAIAQKRVEMLYGFKDADRQNRGYISHDNFIRVISSALLVTSQYLAEITPLLIRKFREIFSTGAIYVNYRAFLAAIKSINEQGVAPGEVKDTPTFRFHQRKGAAAPVIHRVPAPPSADDIGVGEDGNALDVLTVLQKIRKHTARRRINLADFLCDGDNLHLGDISRTKFRSSLARAGILLSPQEHNLLESLFAHESRPDKVNWKAFYAKLQETPRPPEAQLDIVSQSSDSPLLQLLAAIQARISQRRINVKPYFRAFDRSNASQVTFTQFASVMATLGFVLSEVDREMICQAFAVKEAGPYINYRELLKRIDP